MEPVWFNAALWLGIALMAMLLSIWLRISPALSGLSSARLLDLFSPRQSAPRF